MNKLNILIFVIFASSCIDGQGYAPRYGYYPTQQGDWALGAFPLVTQPIIVVWIKKDETVVDGFVVARKPKYYDKDSDRAKYVAKAICAYGNCRPVKKSQEVEVELITESKDNVHISVLPPGANPDGDLSQYVTNTQYYPVRRTVGVTSNYVPGFLEPLPKPKPFRRFQQTTKPFQTKKVHTERKSVKLFDNTPKTVKINGFEAPSVLPRTKPRPNKKYIITKDGYKDIESTPKISKVRRPIVVRRPKPSHHRTNSNNKKYDTVKVNGFETRAVLPRPTARPKPVIITKNPYKEVGSSSRYSGTFKVARGLEAVPNRQRSRNSFNRNDDELDHRTQFFDNTNSKIKENVVGKTSNFEYNDSYDSSSSQEFVYNDFYV